MMSGVSNILAADWWPSFRGSRCPELLRLYRPESAQHLVQFYEDDSFIIDNVAFLAAKAITAGNSSIVVATQLHLEQIRKRLADFDVKADAGQESGQYVPVDAAAALSRFMVDGIPDEAKFNETIGGVVWGAEKNSANGFVFAFGEMVGLLCAANNAQAAIRLEQFWNSLAERHRFSLYCAYSLSSLCNQPSADDLIQICAEHALTIPTETSL
jgi:MEDS: MEthanogen/methylotroph, DcmR Sensory domain